MTTKGYFLQNDHRVILSLTTNHEKMRNVKYKLLIIGLIIFQFSINSSAQNSYCNPSVVSSNVGGLFMREMNGSLYIANNRIWKSNGTNNGTIEIIGNYPNVKDVHSFLYGLESLNDEIFFVTQGNPGVTHSQLWKVDDNNNQSTLVKDFPNVSYITYMTKANGLIFFIVEENYLSSIWKTDGTANGTTMVKELSYYTDFFLYPFNDEVYFVANDPTYGEELWKTDGTQAGTVMIKDIGAGLAGGVSNAFANIENFAVLDNELYFWAMDFPNSFEGGLWKTDGTEIGTVPIKQIGNVRTMSVINNKLILSVLDPTLGEEIWQSDGTETGTYMIKDIRSGNTGSIYHLNKFVELNNKVIFAANDGSNGTELWISDGTEVGTYMIKDINPGTTSSNPYLKDAIVFNGRLYFTANSSVPFQNFDFTIWTTDGTEAGTTQLIDDDGSEFTILNNNLFWSGSGLMTCGSSLGFDAQTSNDISVFPNPAEKSISIQNIPLGCNLIVTDILGKEVIRVNNVQQANYECDVRHLIDGRYLITIINDTESITLKLDVFKK